MPTRDIDWVAVTDLLSNHSRSVESPVFFNTNRALGSGCN